MGSSWPPCSSWPRPALIYVFGVLGWVTYGIRTFLWTVLFGVLTVAGLVVLLSLFD